MNLLESRNFRRSKIWYIPKKKGNTGELSYIKRFGGAWEANKVADC